MRPRSRRFGPARPEQAAALAGAERLAAASSTRGARDTLRALAKASSGQGGLAERPVGRTLKPRNATGVRRRNPAQGRAQGRWLSKPPKAAMGKAPAPPRHAIVVLACGQDRRSRFGPAAPGRDAVRSAHDLSDRAPGACRPAIIPRCPTGGLSVTAAECSQAKSLMQKDNSPPIARSADLSTHTPMMAHHPGDPAFAWLIC